MTLDLFPIQYVETQDDIVEDIRKIWVTLIVLRFKGVCEGRVFSTGGM